MKKVTLFFLSVLGVIASINIGTMRLDNKPVSSGTGLLSTINQLLSFPVAEAASIPEKTPYAAFHDLLDWINDISRLYLNTVSTDGTGFKIEAMNNYPHELSQENRTFFRTLVSEEFIQDISNPPLGPNHGRGWIFVNETIPPFRYEVIEVGESPPFVTKPSVPAHLSFSCPSANIVHLTKDFLDDMHEIDSHPDALAILGNNMNKKLANLPSPANRYSMKEITIVDKFNVQSKHQQQSIGDIREYDALIMLTPYLLTPVELSIAYPDRPSSAWLFYADTESRTLHLIYAKKGLTVDKPVADAYNDASFLLINYYRRRNDINAFDFLAWVSDEQSTSPSSVTPLLTEEEAANLKNQIILLLHNIYKIANRYAEIIKDNIKKSSGRKRDLPQDLRATLNGPFDSLEDHCKKIANLYDLPDSIGKANVLTTTHSSLSTELPTGHPDPSEESDYPVFCAVYIQSLDPRALAMLTKNLMSIYLDLRDEKADKKIHMENEDLRIINDAAWLLLQSRKVYTELELARVKSKKIAEVKDLLF